MPETSSEARCSVRDKPGHGPCGLPSFPDAPFPICPRHMREIATFANELDPVQLVKQNRFTPKYTPAPSQRETYREVVYYVRVGAVVKVGFTGRIKQRIANYPPTAILLATEPGAEELEKQRHKQFTADLAHGREWFHPSADLIAHINTLRETPLTAVDLAA